MAVVDDILAERNCGVVHCGVSRVAQKDVLELARAFGLHDDPSAFAPITASNAAALAASILHKDMAYSHQIMAEERAKELAQQFLEQFGAEAKFYSNGWTGWETGSTEWNPATDATFDTGVLVIGKDRSGCIWVEDED
ncbi:MAG: hypothetical protein ACTHN5_11635 [Phycisphaerae bacterium]